jgi:hypothetical protein
MQARIVLRFMLLRICGNLGRLRTLTPTYQALIRCYDRID